MDTRREDETAKLDAKTLHILREHAEELDKFIHKLIENKLEEGEREEIKADKNLNEYYQTFIRQWSDSWLACLTIHSNKVSNAESNHWDDASILLDKASSYVSLPGAKLLTDILNSGMKFKSNKTKRHAVNKIANFFTGLREGDEVIERVARKLALMQRDKLKKMGEESDTQPNNLKKFCKKVQLYLDTDDVDTDIKELAAEHGKNILNAIIENHLPAHTVDVPLIARCALSKKEEEKALSPRAQFALFQPKPASNDTVMVSASRVPSNDSVVIEHQEKSMRCCVIL